MKSSTSLPIGLSANAVAIAVRIPKQRRSSRATLYSPPPSQAWNCLAVWILPSPGSRRSITSPKLTQSQRLVSALLIDNSSMVAFPFFLSISGHSCVLRLFCQVQPTLISPSSVNQSVTATAFQARKHGLPGDNRGHRVGRVAYDRCETHVRHFCSR